MAKNKKLTDKEIARIKAAANKVVTVNMLGNLARRIAEFNIKTLGYYSFTESETGLKVYVE